MRARYLVLGLLVLVLAAAAAYLVVRPGATDALRATTTITDQAVIGKTVVVFARNPFKDDYDLSHVAGYVDAVGTSDVASVKLDIQLTDADGNRKELVKYVVYDVKAGRRKTYDANAGAIAGSRKAVVKVTAVEVYR